MAKALVHRYGSWLRAVVLVAGLVLSAILIRAAVNEASAAEFACLGNYSELKVGIVIDRSNSVLDANINNPGQIKLGVNNFIRDTQNHKSNLKVGFWSFGTAGSGYVGENPLKTWQLSPNAPDIPAGQYPAINFINMTSLSERNAFIDRVGNIPYSKSGVGDATGSAGWTNWEVALGSNQSNAPFNRPWVPNTNAAGIAGPYPGVISTPPTGAGPFNRSQRSMPQDADMVILITDNSPTVPRRRDNVGGNGEFFGWGVANGKPTNQAEPIDHALDAARRLGQRGVIVHGISIAPAPNPGEEGPVDPNGTKLNLEKVVQAAGTGGTVLQTGFNAGEITRAIQSLIDENETCPYMKVYGGDVQAGGAFGPICDLGNSNATAGIRTVANQFSSGDTATFFGSSTQYAAIAPGPINGFYSANLRNNQTEHSPRAGVDLTFGNTNSGANKVAMRLNPLTLNNPANVGGYSGITNCVTNFYGNLPAGESPKPGGSLSSMPAERIRYVNGDVYINQNLTYPDGTWNSINDIRTFQLVVQGNIFIAPNVSRIDGIYVAQPDPARSNSGRIVTCADSNGNTSSAASACATKLEVNGALIARQVRFKRTNGDISTANTVNEGPGSNNIAEVIKFSPDFYLGPYDSSQARNLPYQKYDYITSLPPVL